MVDINKYFHTQQVLAEQRNGNKKHGNKKHTISQNSISTANFIAKKQSKSFTRTDSNTTEGSGDSLLKPKISTAKESNFDEEYFPSYEDEENNKIKAASSPSSLRLVRNLNKILDDGDNTAYKKRLSDWQHNLSAAKLKQNPKSYYSADIQYILNEYGQSEQVHELKNGLSVPQYIWKELYKYQRNGVKWLWELHEKHLGGMLGDEMGLGKTVQIIAFLAGLYESKIGLSDGLGSSIIVAPATVIYQWVSHFHYWYPPLRVAVLHHSGSYKGNCIKLIKDVHSANGILIMSYAGIVKYTKDLSKRKWHYIILDEGHKIRNPKTKLRKLVKKFQTPHKLMITGSPMQNSLQELWSVFDYMIPGLLGTYKVFMENFAIPITQGGYINATDVQKATSVEIAKVLKNIITPYMLRRTKTEVQKHIKLPEKNEQVLFCALTKEQRDLYMGYLMSGTVKSILSKNKKYENPLRARVLVALSTLNKICNHPDLYLHEAEKKYRESGEEFGHWKRSGKMSVVHSLLKLWDKQGHRTLIFSQSRAMIHVLEQHMQTNNFKYLKMDGTVAVSQRQTLIKTFNENEEYLVFLSTTRVGGLGINLTGADRVIVYDPDWNPATDNQAKERAWRIGQKKNVTVYRLLSAGTIEEKIYQRQIFKNLLSNKILMEPNQKNVFDTSILQDLFSLENLTLDKDSKTVSLFKHTEINLNSKKIHLGANVTGSKEKLNIMRRKAKEISKNISKANVNSNTIKKYMNNTEMILNQIKHPAVTTVNVFADKKACLSDDNVLAELDEINKHVKIDMDEKFMNDILNVPNVKCEDVECIDHSKMERIKYEADVTNEESKGVSQKRKIIHETIVNQVEQYPIEKNRFKKLRPSNIEMNSNQLDILKRNEVINTHERKYYPSSVPFIENILGVKKLKKQKYKRKNINDEDDYILKQLFAKATVKSVLKHDAIVGLREKEKAYKIKEVAIENAEKAVTAIKLSTKNVTTIRQFKFN